MRLSPPRAITWWICLILGALSVLLHLKLIVIPALTFPVFWIVVVALVIMLLATVLSGL